MASPKNNDLPDTEIERRREEALKRMLSTPHQPHNPIPKEPKIPRQTGAGKKNVRKRR